jgi:hypothetical protein
MGEPTLFLNAGGNRKEPDKSNETASIHQAALSASDTEPLRSSLTSENEFSRAAEIESESAAEIGTDLDNAFELSSLGSMNTIPPRPEPEVNAADPMDQIALETNKESNSDDLELSPAFTGEDILETNSDIKDLEGLDIGNLDLFADMPEEEASSPQPEEVEDGSIALELDMDDNQSLDDLLADLEKKT